MLEPKAAITLMANAKQQSDNEFFECARKHARLVDYINNRED